MLLTILYFKAELGIQKHIKSNYFAETLRNICPIIDKWLNKLWYF